MHGGKGPLDRERGGCSEWPLHGGMERNVGWHAGDSGDSVLGWDASPVRATVFSSLNEEVFGTQVSVAQGQAPPLSQFLMSVDLNFLIHKSKGENTTPLSWCGE